MSPTCRDVGGRRGRGKQGRHGLSPGGHRVISLDRDRLEDALTCKGRRATPAHRAIPTRPSRPIPPPSRAGSKPSRAATLAKAPRRTALSSRCANATRQFRSPTLPARLREAGRTIEHQVGLVLVVRVVRDSLDPGDVVLGERHRGRSQPMGSAEVGPPEPGGRGRCSGFVFFLSGWCVFSVEVQVFEERVDLSNDMTWRQMIAVGVRRVVLARGELDRLEGPGCVCREEGRVAPMPMLHRHTNANRFWEMPCDWGGPSDCKFAHQLRGCAIMGRRAFAARRQSLG